MHGDAQARQRGGAQAAQAAAGTNQAPGTPGTFQGIERGGAGHAGRGEQYQRQRLARIDRGPRGADPRQPVPPHQTPPLIPRSAFRQHQIEFPGILLLVKSCAQSDRQFQIDQCVPPDEVAQQFRQAGADEILRCAEPQPASQLGAGEVLPRTFVCI
jgi:hypothetical protein